MVAKVERHPGELHPRVGLDPLRGSSVTDLSRPAERVVAFYNQRGKAEQCIKEGKNAIKWTRLSCRKFRDNAVRLQLHALAYSCLMERDEAGTPAVLKAHHIEVNDPKLDKLELRKKVGMVFQQYNLFPHKTAIENVMMAPIHVLKQPKGEVEERAIGLIKKVRLEGKEHSYPGELSGGQQQRVAIARSLAMNPEIMLFDEITAALDPETVKEVLFTIQELAEEGMTCALATHEMGFAREIADHIYFTDRGIIVEHGPPKTFFTDAKDPRTKEFLSQRP